jgi:hypothetical protein
MVVVCVEWNAYPSAPIEMVIRRTRTDVSNWKRWSSAARFLGDTLPSILVKEMFESMSMFWTISSVDVQAENTTL